MSKEQTFATTPEYEGWWQLHLRTARGEVLSSAEQEAYQAGLARMEVEEAKQLESNDLEPLLDLRAQIDHGAELHAQLLARSAQLDTQIAALEEAYQQLTGIPLAVESYTSS